MDLEQSLIAHVVKNELMREAVDQQVRASLFFGPGKKVWEWMVSFFREFGTTPTEGALQKAFPEYVFEESMVMKEPLAYLLAELRKRKAHNVLHQGMAEVAKALKAKDSYEAVGRWRQVMLEVDEDIRPSRDVSWVRDAEKRVESYRELKEQKGVDGLAMPWPMMNSLTQGLHDEDFVMVVARQNVGKTWAELIMAHYVWTQGYVPLVLTKEMSVLQILRRLDAKHFRLPYMPLRSGELDTETEAEWMEGTKLLKEMHDFWVSGDDTEGGVSGVAAKIDMYKPRIVFIDGGSFLMDERKGESQWQRMANVSSDLKRVARRARIPLVCSFQLSKKASRTQGEAEDIAWADISRDADVILGAFQSPDQRELKELELKILKQREGPWGSWKARWDFESMEFYEIGASAQLGGEQPSPDDEDEEVDF